MSLDTIPRRPAADPTRPSGRRPPGSRQRQRAERPDPRTALSTLVVLVVACSAIIALDVRGGADSPLAPVRDAVGSVLGPAETTVSDAVRPFAAAPSWFRDRAQLRGDVARLQRQNSGLRQQLETTSLDRNRLAEYDGLARAATATGYTLVPAHVVALGPAQSFSRTVTIDAGTRSGVTADTTVVADDGLVGRVVRATATTATVLLIVDSDSVVGGRVASSMEIGMLHGRGSLGADSADSADSADGATGGGGDQLDLDLVDDTVVPAAGDTVVTWGSRGSGPYVSGIPVGRVTSVVSSPRDSAQHAVVAPYVDFGSLDLVGVVVPAGTHSDRGLMTPAGTPGASTGGAR